MKGPGKIFVLKITSEWKARQERQKLIVKRRQEIRQRLRKNVKLDKFGFFFFKLLICLSVFNLGRLMKQKYGKSALRTQLRLPTSSPLLKFAIGNIIQTYFTAY